MNRLALLLVLASSVAFAHKPSDSYVHLVPQGDDVQLRWDVALRDADHALGLDANGDGAITWSEVRASEPMLRQLAQTSLLIRTNGAPCALTFGPLQIVEHSDGNYAVLNGSCPGSGAIELDYRAFFASDPQHRAIVRVGAPGSAASYVLSHDSHTLRATLSAPSPWSRFGTVVVSGMRHIWEGTDHLLFLFALLLPSVVRREKGRWVAVSGFRKVAMDVLRVVSAFTVAHSLTLSASAFGLITLPSRFVESAIAASVIFAAANNVWPFMREGRWMAAFALGLLHGFGFSSSLADLGVGGSGLLVTLFGFNVGVELGQLWCVLAFLPFAYLLRSSLFYRRFLLVGGSAVIVLTASVWLTERAFALQLFPT